MGSKGRPFYRVVVADQRAARDGRFIENIGRYHPLNDPSVIEIDQERALHWLRVGAQPSSQVRNLMEKVGIWEVFLTERPSAAVAAKHERPAKEKLSKKAQAKAAEATKAASAPAPAPAAAEPEAAEPEAAEPEAAEPEAAEPEAAEPEAAEPVAEDETTSAADAEESAEA
jgi:small subunit ribosomal protein S16